MSSAHDIHDIPRMPYTELQQFHDARLFDWSQLKQRDPSFVQEIQTSAALPLGSSERGQVTSLVLSKLERLSSLVDTINQLRIEVMHDFIRLSPICYLPSEILIRIFLFTRPVRDHNEIRRSDNPTPFPSIRDAFCDPPLTLVCKRWRELSMNTPHFWNSLEIGFSGPGRGDVISEPQEAILKRRLHRTLSFSCQLPLYILADFKALGNYNWIIFCELGPYLARCASIVMNLGPDSLLVSLLSEFSESGSLKNAIITTPSEPYESDSDLFFRGVYKIYLENLSTLTVESYSVYHFPRMTCPALTQLSYITSRTSFETLANATGPDRMPLLRRLELNNVQHYTQTGHAPDAPIISYPLLEEFICVAAMPFLIPVLDASPVLKTVHIGSPLGGKNDLPNLPSRSIRYPLIQTLVIRGSWPCSESGIRDWILEILRCMPNIRSLTFCGGPTTDGPPTSIWIYIQSAIFNSSSDTLPYLSSIVFEDQAIDLRDLISFSVARESISNDRISACRISLSNCLLRRHDAVTFNLEPGFVIPTELNMDANGLNALASRISQKPAS